MPSLALLLFASSAQPLQGIVPNQLQHGEAYCASCRHLRLDRKSTRLNSSHSQISYAVFCLKKKNQRDSKRVRSVGEQVFTGVCLIMPTHQGHVTLVISEPIARTPAISSHHVSATIHNSQT